MQNINPKRLAVFSISLLLASCVIDTHPLVAIVKNNSPNRLLIAKQPDQVMTDSILYNEGFSKGYLEINNSQGVTVPNIKLSSQPDSYKIYIYIFNCDSVDKYQASKKVEGVMKNSFIKKVEIQVNKVKDPVDTIYIK